MPDGELMDESVEAEAVEELRSQEDGPDDAAETQRSGDGLGCGRHGVHELCRKVIEKAMRGWRFRGAIAGRHFKFQI